jgi:hypothetical protein
MKPHRFDPLSFIAGLIATVIGLAFLIPADPTNIVDLLDDFGAWFWPVLLVVIGIAIIIPAVTGGRDDEGIPADTETEQV